MTFLILRVTMTRCSKFYKTLNTICKIYITVRTKLRSREVSIQHLFWDKVRITKRYPHSFFIMPVRLAENDFNSPGYSSDDRTIIFYFFYFNVSFFIISLHKIAFVLMSLHFSFYLSPA